ncbi:heparinase II/III-family protein [Puniceicoccaceae bacterium K14]|nr:heparinase II/III-family protein [Puniceicoccaceae bacterium K14]
MTRRELLRITGSSILLASLPSTFKGQPAEPSSSEGTRLFFDLNEIPKIRANSKTELLGPLYQKWEEITPAELESKFDTFDKSGDVIGDFMRAVTSVAHVALVHIVNPSKERENAIVRGIRRLIAIDNWDFFLDGDKPIGIQRASLASEYLLFAREVLDDKIEADLDQEILKAVAEKGCLPCYRAIHGMNNPDTVEGWRFTERHSDYYDLSMERWPMILGANNLRAAPSGALGIGALALIGHDSRAEKWLETAIASVEFVFTTFSPDGSYFEGLSYSEYTLRSLLAFCEAHARSGGKIDWIKKANFEGMVDYMLSMQLGKNEDGTPDIVNFSDARSSINPGAPSWIGKHTQNPVAQYAAEKVSLPRLFYDFLWFDGSRPSTPPPKAFKNVRNDLDWVLSRSGWEANDGVVAFRSGGPCNHEHADRNHITYKVFGERLLTDLFGAAYDKRNPGWLLRQTEAHNAVLVDGRGCHYHDGNEGVNDTKSYATITEYEDHGDTVWWTSDASPAYLIENDHITKVIRTVIFSKPDVIVILDQVRLHFAPQSMTVNFYPDNRDGFAKLSAKGNTFSIGRPKARLHGTIYSNSDVSVSTGKLGVPLETGDFPRIQLNTDPAYNHEILTILRANPKGNNPRAINTKSIKDGWSIKGEDLELKIDTRRVVPSVTLV